MYAPTPHSRDKCGGAFELLGVEYDPLATCRIHEFLENTALKVSTRALIPKGCPPMYRAPRREPHCRNKSACDTSNTAAMSAPPPTGGAHWYWTHFLGQALGAILLCGSSLELTL